MLGGHKHPAFINLPQPYFEKFLHDAIVTAQSNGAPIEIRGKNRVDAVVDHGAHVTLDVTTPDRPYQIEADWLVACDGARSPLRGIMGQNFDSRVFEDNFLIADVRMDADFPPNAGSGSPRGSNPAIPRWCTNHQMASGGLICNSAGISPMRQNQTPPAFAPASTKCWGRT